MKRILIIVLTFLSSQIHAQTYSIPTGVKRILFLGNSITYNGKYVSFIDAYLTLKYPNRNFEIINLGLPSETVSGLSEPNHAGGKFPRPVLQERLERALTNIKPDLVFACYGMNDGIYLPFDDERFQQFKDGIKRLHEQVLASGAPIVHITPSVYDPRKGAAYANVLDLYSDWLISSRYSMKWDVLDLHGPMKKFLEDRRLVDTAFLFAKDGVHPNDLGHFVMAKAILLGLGETELAKATDIQSALLGFKNSDAVFKLVEERQTIMKDAWLSLIGHKRPGMKVGLPLRDAQIKRDEIDLKIQALLKQN
jgi:lysophospholipase L1-like esterase